jgi:hypothetical protein
VSPTKSRPGGKAVGAGGTTVFPDRVGGVRPSQLMYSFGVGAMVDLPNFSIIVGGLDDWSVDYTAEIAEERLLAAIRAEAGLGLAHVNALRSAPWVEETRNPFDEWARVGVPAVPFPRWLRCSACALLASIDSGLFEVAQNPFRPDRTRYVHKNCTKAKGRTPTAISARFVVACPDGHIDDFPWPEFVHAKFGGTCPTGAFQLRAHDVGAGTRSTDLLITCVKCNTSVPMTIAFGESAANVLPLCRGRHAHLRSFDKTCKHVVRPLLLGASNAWFPAARSVLSIPASADPVGQVVAEVWPAIEKYAALLDGSDKLAVATQIPELKALAGYDPAAVWAAIEARRAGAPTDAGEVDLLAPEWVVFCDPKAATASRDFRLESPTELPEHPGIASVRKATRLREVVALCGFTRIDGPDSGVGSDVEGPIRLAPMSRKPIPWVPAAEARGEGIFLRFDEDTVSVWEDRVADAGWLDPLREAHRRWRRNRGYTNVDAGWPGDRYVLFHSLAHALINEVALECGYSAASIRERIYSSEPGDDGSGAMAGILLYTAAPDSEGTLGGLVSLGEPDELDRILDAALRRAGLCSADPLCATHSPEGLETTLHRAACHSCLFLPETSCERGNRYLDRNVLAGTLAAGSAAYPFRT